MCAFLSLSVMVFIRQKISQYKGRIAAYRKVRLTTLGTSKQKKNQFPQRNYERRPTEKSRACAPAEVLLYD